MIMSLFFSIITSDIFLIDKKNTSVSMPMYLSLDKWQAFISNANANNMSFDKIQIWN